MRRIITTLVLGAALAGSAFAQVTGAPNGAPRAAVRPERVLELAQPYRIAGVTAPPQRLENADRRDELAARTQEVALEAERLYQEGRLSLDHYERTLAKLYRPWDTVVYRAQIDPERYQADLDWTAGTERTMRQWAQANTR